MVSLPFNLDNISHSSNFLIYVILQYPLCTLLVFDSRQHALPVAWVVTRTIAKPDVSKWMKALHDRVRAVDPTWKVNGVLIDDAAAEIDPIRQNSCGLLFLSVKFIT